MRHCGKKPHSGFIAVARYSPSINIYIYIFGFGHFSHLHSIDCHAALVGSTPKTIRNQTITPHRVLLSSVVGTALDIELTFTTQTNTVLSLAVREAGSQQTVTRYKQSTGTLSVDRTASRDTSMMLQQAVSIALLYSPIPRGWYESEYWLIHALWKSLKGKGKLLFPTLSSRMRQQMA